MIKTPKCPTQKISLSHHIDFTNRYSCNNDDTLSNFTSIPKLQGPVQLSVIPTDDELRTLPAEHSITQDEFEDMVGKFFFPNPVPFPENRTVAEMQGLIAQAGAQNIIQFAYDDFDRDSNSILITAPVPERPLYSAHLFRGILLLFPQVANFHFYKAIDTDGFTVAIAAVDGYNNVLYLGELSGLFP